MPKLTIDEKNERIELLKMLRERYNLSQKKMGTLLGVTWNTVQRYENGSTAITNTVNILLKIYFDYPKIISKLAESLNRKKPRN